MTPNYRNRLPPSPFNSDFSSADLGRVSLSPERAAQYILEQQRAESAGAAADPTIALLAALYKTQRKSNANYRPAAFTFAAWNRQLIFSENPSREYLLIQNVGSGDLMVLFEDGPTALEDDSNANGQVILAGMQTRAVRIVAGGYFEPLVAPRNSITLFTVSTGTQGIAIDGSA